MHSFLDFDHFFQVQAIVGPNNIDSLRCLLLKNYLCACLYFQLQALVISQLCAETRLVPPGAVSTEPGAQPSAGAGAPSRSAWTWWLKPPASAPKKTVARNSLQSHVQFNLHITMNFSKDK